MADLHHISQGAAVELVGSLEEVLSQEAISWLLTDASVAIVMVPGLATKAVRAQATSRRHAGTEPYDIVLTGLTHFFDLLNYFRDTELTTRRQIFFVLDQTFRVCRVCPISCERIRSCRQDET